MSLMTERLFEVEPVPEPEPSRPELQVRFGIPMIDLSWEEAVPFLIPIPGGDDE